MTSTTVETRSGRVIDIQAPLPEDIVIEDIAYSLAGQYRFCGHTRYTVAQHSVRVSDRLIRHGSPCLSMSALLHDAGEAYMSDVSRPVKKHLPWFVKTEDRLLNVIYVTFGLDPSPVDIKLINLADECELRHEAHQFMHSGGWGWPWSSDTLESWDEIATLGCEGAERAFMHRFRIYESRMKDKPDPC